MIKKLMQITCALTLLTGSAHISAVSKPVSLSLNLEMRGWSPKIEAILGNPNTNVEQKMAEMLELAPMHGRRASNVFGYALAELVMNGLQLDQVVERDGTTFFHKLMASPNFTSGTAGWFMSEAFASSSDKKKPSPYDKFKITESFFDELLSKPNAGGQTPLYFAAETNPTILRSFISLYPAFAKTINTQTKGGKSPLFKAAEVGNQQSVEILLENNADITLRDQFGLTAYDTAVRNGHTEIANLIAEYAKSNGITNFANKYKN